MVREVPQLTQTLEIRGVSQQYATMHQTSNSAMSLYDLYARIFDRSRKCLGCIHTMINPMCLQCALKGCSGEPRLHNGYNGADCLTDQILDGFLVASLRSSCCTKGCLTFDILGTQLDIARIVSTWEWLLHPRPSDLVISPRLFLQFSGK
jgi:hypothetical protein